MIMSKTLRQSVMEKMAMDFCKGFDEAANNIGFENAFEIVNMITLLSFEELELLTETCNLVFGIIDMYRNPELIFTEKSKNTSPGNSCQE